MKVNSWVGTVVQLTIYADGAHLRADAAGETVVAAQLEVAFSAGILAHVCDPPTFDPGKCLHGTKSGAQSALVAQLFFYQRIARQSGLGEHRYQPHARTKARAQQHVAKADGPQAGVPACPHMTEACDRLAP